jgi:hypothetical protein
LDGIIRLLKAFETSLRLELKGDLPCQYLCLRFGTALNPLLPAGEHVLCWSRLHSPWKSLPGDLCTPLGPSTHHRHDIHSILWRTTHREFKHHTPPRQLLIHLPIRIQSVINTTSLLLIQYNLQQFTPVLLCPNSLSHNLNRVHHIRQDRIVNSSKGSGARTFLGLVRTAAVGTLGPRENTAGREDEHMAI